MGNIVIEEESIHVYLNISSGTSISYYRELISKSGDCLVLVLSP